MSFVDGRSLPHSAGTSKPHSEAVSLGGFEKAALQRQIFTALYEVTWVWLQYRTKYFTSISTADSVLSKRQLSHFTEDLNYVSA